jgi:mono/diheme cytochrome c family protein
VSSTFAGWGDVIARLWCGPLLLCSALVVGGCQKAPTEVREWSPKDHTNISNKPAEQTGQVNANPAPTEAPPKGLDPVTLAAWGSQCSSCHGKIGKGDGPNGKMLKATDLSNPDWQAQITDEQIQKSISGGKNAMPAFANLPVDTVENLMWLVRWFNSDQVAVQARMERLKASTAGASGTPTGVPETATTGRSLSTVPTPESTRAEASTGRPAAGSIPTVNGAGPKLPAATSTY